MLILSLKYKYIKRRTTVGTGILVRLREFYTFMAYCNKESLLGYKKAKFM